MKDFIEINETEFDRIATFAFTVNHSQYRPNTLRLISPVLHRFDEEYSDRKGFYVEDYTLEDNNIVFYNWNYTTNSYEQKFSLPVEHFYFSPKKGCFSFTGKYLNEEYSCLMYLLYKQLPF